MSVNPSDLNNIAKKLSNGMDLLGMMDSATYLDPKITANVDEETQQYATQIIENHIDPLFDGDKKEQLKGLIIDGFVSYIDSDSLPTSYFTEFLEMIFDQIIIGRVRELVWLKKKTYYLKLLKNVLEQLSNYGESSDPEYNSIHKRIVELFTSSSKSNNPTNTDDEENNEQLGGTTTKADFLYPLNYVKDLSKTVTESGIESFVHTEIFNGVYMYFTKPRLNKYIKLITPNLNQLSMNMVEGMVMVMVQNYSYEQCIVLLYSLFLDEYLMEQIQSIKPVLGGNDTNDTNDDDNDLSNKVMNIVEQLKQGLNSFSLEEADEHQQRRDLGQYPAGHRQGRRRVRVDRHRD